MVDLPNELLLRKIQAKHLYLDRKSKEPTTNTIKPKYKLAGNIILEQYFFNIITKTLSACKDRLTLKIEQKHWEDRVSGPYLKERVSFCDLTKWELLERKDLIEKMKDKANTFPYIARLCDSKYRELQHIRNRISRISYIPKEAKAIITEGISPIIDEVVSKLGLD